MELTDLPMFGLVRRRLAWLNQRQEVVAQNLANADTPEYKAHDIEKFQFRDVLRRHRTGPKAVQLVATDPQHISSPNNRAAQAFRDSDRDRPYETAPDGNQVVLEEQMVKMNETQANHGLMTQLYRKHHALYKMVTRNGGGS